MIIFVATFMFGQSSDNSLANEKVSVDSHGNLTSKRLRRNLKRYKYDDGGKSSCDSIIYSQRIKMTVDDACGLKKLRDFILDHLSNKKRGRALTVSFGVDTGIVYHLFIQPDQSGEWGIDLWSQGYSALPGSRKRPFSYQRIVTIDQVKDVKSGDLMIFLKNKTGEVELKLPPYR